MVKTWKTVENRIAKRFGSTRTPLSGSNSKHTQSDTLHSKLYIEIKHGESSLIETMYKSADKHIAIVIQDGRNRRLFMAEVEDFANGKIVEVKTIQRKNFAIFSLFADTIRKAKEENKIPLVCIHKKGKHSFLIVCRFSNAQTIKEFLNG
ncbi:MAG: hypothetical protein KKF27_20690 [Gammaproteobacteria bacterium]|nr:hypothetical protein [Gammaproteobacteria bacterium]